MIVLASLARHGVCQEAPERSEATLHYDRGLELYNAQNYEAAIPEFKHSYTLEPRPNALFAWAQAERLRGNCVAAVGLYRKLLGGKLSEKQLDVTKAQLSRCEKLLAEQQARTAPEAPPVTSARLSPPAPRRPPWYRDVWGDALVGLGAVGLGIGVAYFVASSSTQDDAGRAPDSQAYERGIADAETQRTVAIAGLVTGATLVAAGVVRYVLRKPEPARAAQLSGWATAQSGGLTLRFAY